MENQNRDEGSERQDGELGEQVDKLEFLPPPPPVIPADVVPIKAVQDIKISKPVRLPVSRPGTGKGGRPIALLSNHFKSEMTNMDGYFYQYSVSFPSRKSSIP